jgi:NDP-sugar pyrophosphorylase family protein
MFLCEIAFLKTLRPSDFPSIEKELLPALIQRNQLCAYDNSDNLMFDYGTPERLRQFSEIQDIVQRILSK